MALDERSRHELFLRLEEALGREAATTLMEHLPPVGWADVATKRDLATLESVMNSRFEAIDHRFDAVDHRFETIDHRFDAVESRLLAEIRAMGARTFRADIALIVAVMSVVFAAVRLR